MFIGRHSAVSLCHFLGNLLAWSLISFLSVAKMWLHLRGVTFFVWIGGSLMPTRLRDRGYPPRFLRKAFGPAPRLGRLRALAMPYSRELERTNLARVLRAHGALLPSHLVGDKSLVAWCAAPRLAAALIQYRYTSA